VTATLSGASAANYTLTQPIGLAANITPLAVTETGGTAANKVYDGTTAAALSGGTLNGVIAGDNVSLSQSGTFASTNAGTGIIVAATLSGPSAGNYTLTQPNGLAANITPRAISVSGTVLAGDKQYDGTKADILTGGTLVGVINGDIATLSLSGIFATQNVGTGIAVTPTLNGASAGNYSLTGPTGLVANITPAGLTATIIGAPSKIYDGTNTAALTSANYRLSGFAQGEGATIGKISGTYNSPNVLTANSVSTTLASADFSPNTGTLLSNYALPSGASGAGSITPAGVSPTANAATQMANRFVFSGTPNITANMGSYAMIPNSFYSTMYNVSYTNSLLTITSSSTQVGLTGGVYDIWYGILKSYKPRLLVGM